jgi:hypothetical protein
MVLIKGQAQFNYVKYYLITSRWILIDQKKTVYDRNNKLSCISKLTYVYIYIYTYILRFVNN